MEKMGELLARLVSDLPNMGGWPKWAVECILHRGSCKAMFYDEGGRFNGYPSFPDIKFEEEALVERVVYREMYEAALAASKEMIINKPDSDGWISWCGGECPVDGDVVVDVKFRAQGQADLDGDVADNFRWEHFSNGADVVAYRMHKSEHQKPEWDGEGLPPVGCECEYETNGYGIKKVLVECITMDGIAFTWLGEDPRFRGLDCINTSQSHRFRPIRSEADKKRDEAIKKICEVLSVGKNAEDDAKNIYEYIKSGKIVID